MPRGSSSHEGANRAGALGRRDARPAGAHLADLVLPEDLGNLAWRPVPFLPELLGLCRGSGETFGCGAWRGADCMAPPAMLAAVQRRGRLPTSGPIASPLLQIPRVWRCHTAAKGGARLGPEVGGRPRLWKAAG